MLVNRKEPNKTFRHLNIQHEYQPLWDLQSWNVYGYEGLFRSESNLNPEVTFSEARKNSCLFELDTYSLSKAIEFFPNFKTQYLFLNVYPSTLLHSDFPGFITKAIQTYPIIVDRLILELNETSEEEHVWHIPALREKVTWLQSLGINIALDDLGKGAASLNKIIEFRPLYVKLDRYFSQKLSESKQKQKMVSLLSQYCEGEGITLIIEGIEKPVDLALAKLLNVPIGQGFLMGKPGRL